MTEQTAVGFRIAGPIDDLSLAALTVVLLDGAATEDPPRVRRPRRRRYGRRRWRCTSGAPFTLTTKSVVEVGVS
ncbi:hypothetical protein [Nocardia arthritidis]|uniref:Acyl-CoA carboxylase subunit epsilon n=1 Tax=Nocardia arthritidis TaxID=228602 RepID=A0A6G9YA39_9NOCA|nr:hypothetical protein [Nocardia arthritidis]QIS10028.1 hypothetical protein F5544_10655 [Nocardia arthritidis]